MSRRIFIFPWRDASFVKENLGCFSKRFRVFFFTRFFWEPALQLIVFQRKVPMVKKCRWGNSYWWNRQRRPSFAASMPNETSLVCLRLLSHEVMELQAMRCKVWIMLYVREFHSMNLYSLNFCLYLSCQLLDVSRIIVFWNILAFAIILPSIET